MLISLHFLYCSRFQQLRNAVFSAYSDAQGTASCYTIQCIHVNSGLGTRIHPDRGRRDDTRQGKKTVKKQTETSIRTSGRMKEFGDHIVGDVNERNRTKQ